MHQHSVSCSSNILCKKDLNFPINADVVLNEFIISHKTEGVKPVYSIRVLIPPPFIPFLPKQFDFSLFHAT